MKRHPELTTCHFCAEKIGWFKRLFMIGVHFRNCPNCGRFHLFHKQHYAGFGLWRGLEGFQPRCGGEPIPQHRTHRNGHMAARHEAPMICSRCGMFKPIWDHWYCTPGTDPAFVNARNGEFLQTVQLKGWTQ